MTRYQEMALADVASITMGTSPKGDTYNNNGVGLPLLNGPTEFGAFHPSCTLFTTVSKRECKRDALIFCVRGSTTGRMNWADQVYSLGRGVCSIRGETQQDTRFIKYSLDHKLEALLAIAGGGTFPNLTKNDIFSFPIPYPPHRHKIAAILSAYDDLIENNTRRIALLEHTAQLLYREWFVHFRFPGHESIPLVESELGPIPEGWEVRTLGQFGKVITGKTPSKKVPEYYDNYMSFIKIPDMHGNIFCTQTIDNLSKLGTESQRQKTIPPNSLCVSCIGSAGLVTITTVPSQTNQQINSTVLQNEADREFLYFALIGLRETINRYGAIGATMVNLSRGKFVNLRVIYPDVGILDAFHTMTYPHFEQIRVLQLKNANLRATRDLLLPRLISGQLDVSELEILTGECSQ